MKPETARILPLNAAQPLVMHIDLNSCFAIIEQQANRLLRGRPVGVAAYDTPKGFVLAASYQAKAMGVKLGVNCAEARQLCPGIVIVTPDPSKYREAHKRFKQIMLEYTSDVEPKSIDEFVMNLAHSPSQRIGVPMEDIGLEVKTKIAASLGEAVTVNIGIGPNRFLAKLAAGLHKPDGMDRITHVNIREVLGGLDLLDLPGINTRYKRRLKMYGINTPLEFLDADRIFLQKTVFESITGYYWYLRLRGYEIDNYKTVRRTIGHQYALSKPTEDPEELARLLVKLCEKIGRRLRKNEIYAGGIHLYLSFVNYQQMDFARTHGFIGGERSDGKKSWHHGEKVSARLYSTADIYQAACRLLSMAEIGARVRGMSITVFDLHPCDPEQLELFEFGVTQKNNGSRESTITQDFTTRRRISDAVDRLNNRYGEFVITPGSMMDMHGTILDRIAFGGVRDLE